MPDLEERIMEWRWQMRAAGIQSPVPLDELESHLREDLERRMQSGASAPEAFAAAVEQLGEAAALKNEFVKSYEATSARLGKYFWRGSALAAGLFVVGISLCYFVILPFVMPANERYAAWLGMEAPQLRNASYVSFVCKLLFSFGAAFALPAGVLTLVNGGFLDCRRLVSLRRYVIVLNLVLAALMTTPEVVTQLLMFIPLQLIYEVSVGLVWYSQWKEMKCA
jgi:hypothetical protein